MAPRVLPGYLPESSPMLSPCSGANAATNTSALTSPLPWAAFDITEPPQEWPTTITGPSMAASRLRTKAASPERLRRGFAAATVR